MESRISARANNHGALAAVTAALALLVALFVAAPASLAEESEHGLAVDDSCAAFVTADRNQAAAGDTIKLTLGKPETGTLKYIAVSSEEGTRYYEPEGDSATISFQMPDGDATVSADVDTKGAWTDEGNYDEAYYQKAAGNWKIYNAAQLAAFAKKLQDDGTVFSQFTITLVNDIDLSDHYWTPVKGARHFAIEGNGHAITGLNVRYNNIDTRTYRYGRDYGMFVDNSRVTFSGTTLQGRVDARRYANSVQSQYDVAGVGANSEVALTGCIVDIDVSYSGLPRSDSNKLEDVRLCETSTYLPGVLNGASLANNAIEGSLSVSDCALWRLTLGTDYDRGAEGDYNHNSSVNNNALLTDVNIGRDVTSSTGAVYYLGRYLGSDAGSNTWYANNYYAGTVTNEGTFETPLTQGFYADGDLGGCYRVDANASADDKATLLAELNEWVDGNADGAVAYASWKYNDDGWPVPDAGTAVSASDGHAVTLNSVEHGCAAVPEAAQAGQTVTVYAIPDPLYRTQAVTYTDASGTHEAVQDEADAEKYTFQMPDSDVTVSATFVSTAHGISVTQSGSGSVTVQGQTNLYSDKAATGETVKVNATAEKDYAIDSVEVTCNGAEVELETSGTGVYSFQMPDGDVVVKAAFKRVSFYNADGTLADGTYSVPASIKVWPGANENSMANAALDGPLTVTVKDGKATYTTTWKGITLTAGGVEGHLLRLWIWPDATATGTEVEATPIETMEVTGADGKEYTFPKRFQFTREPASAEEMICIRVHVDAMGDSDQNALLVPEWGKIQETEAEDGDVEASRTALNEAIEDASEVSNGSGAYTAASFKALTDAVAAGKAAAAKDDATATELDAAASAIKLAKSNLAKASAGKSGTGSSSSSSSKSGKSSGTAAKKAASATVGGITYKVSGKTAVVTGAKASIKKAAIRASVKIGGRTYKVTKVKSGAFKGKKKLAEVTVGKNVTSIGKSAFQGAKRLASVTLGKAVRTVGAKAFYKDAKLKKVAFKGKKVKKVGSKAFKGISKKAVVKAPKAKLAKYQKLVRKAGAAKTVKFKKA